MRANLKLPYSKWQFGIFRILFGGYLLVHFLHLLPFAKDIWSKEGFLTDPTLNITYGGFPNILYYLESPHAVTGFVGGMALLSLLLLLGIKRRIVSLLLWFGWACLFHQNNLISNPGLPMVGWLLLALSLIPAGEALVFGNRQGSRTWYMPKSLFFGAWAIVGLAYTISGIDKYAAPSWQDGTALLHLLHNPLARDWIIRDLLLVFPLPLIKGLTWTALGLEISFAFLCVFRKTRFYAWLAIMGMHLGILTVIDFADLTLGVIMIHLFTIDPLWFVNETDHRQKIVFFDGHCGFCNGWVNFLLDIDFNKQLRFSPLQSDQAKPYIGDSAIYPDTILYYQDGILYTKSSAILEIMQNMGGLWSFTVIFKVIPTPIRDKLYDVIARHRYKLFGKNQACRLPTPDEQDRFL